MDLSRVPRVRGDQLAPGPCPQGDPCRPDRPGPRQATTSGPWVAHQVSGPESVELLRQCWAVLDGPTGKRLRPALPELLANLSAHGDLVENRLPGHDRPPPRGASFNSARRITVRLDFLSRR